LTHLTEYCFRGYWKRARGKESVRFSRVADVIANGIPQGMAGNIDRTGARNLLPTRRP
jgi:hypothetical protein